MAREHLLTAELISRLTDENVIPCDRDMHLEVVAVLTAQAQKIELLEAMMHEMSDDIS